MEPGKAEATVTNQEKKTAEVNWRFVRKIEALVFASMFLAVPFFAYRIVELALP